MTDAGLEAAQAITQAVGVALAEASGQLEERFAEFRAELVDRMADAISAAQVEPKPGRDGLDRILALPRYVKAGESCDANVIAWANAGLWQSVRATSGGPADDPSGWQCLVPGVAAIETRQDMTARELVIGLRMSDGHLHECRGRMPATALPPDFLQMGWGVLAGDTLRPPGEDIELMALRDGATLGRAEDWQEVRLRGFRGQKGERGDKGQRGPGLAGLSLLSDGAGGVAMMPRYDDPTIRAEPVALDMLTAEPEPGDAPIIGFAGPWKAARTYRRGAVVSAEHGGAVRLLLSVKPDNNAAPGDERAWRVML